VGNDSLLMLTGHGVDDISASQPRLPYNTHEQQLSRLIQHEIDHLLIGRHDDIVLLKLYPRRGDDGPTLRSIWNGEDAAAIRGHVAARMAADTLAFFGPLHGGIITQEQRDDLIVQARTFSTVYPHIRLERYDVYDSISSEPLVGSWRAQRIQNQRRETQTNRMVDLALLALEISKSLFPLLRG